MIKFKVITDYSYDEEGNELISETEEIYLNQLVIQAIKKRNDDVTIITFSGGASCEVAASIDKVLELIDEANTTYSM